MSDGGYCARCKTATYGVHECPKPEAPMTLGYDANGIQPYIRHEPTKDSGAREWTVAGFKEYLELHRRNYELDNLWGPDEKKCSDDFARFVELEQFFIPLDNKRALIAAYEKLEQDLAEMTEKFERNSIAAGEYSLQVEEQKKTIAVIALDRNANHFLLTQERKKSAELLEALKGCVGYEPFGPADLNPYKASEAIARYSRKGEE